MADSKQRVIVTGHNKESSARVVHYLRTAGPPSGLIEFQGGLYVTDDKHIVADDTEIDLTITATVVK